MKRWIVIHQTPDKATTWYATKTLTRLSTRIVDALGFDTKAEADVWRIALTQSHNTLVTSGPFEVYLHDDTGGPDL